MTLRAFLETTDINEYPDLDKAHQAVNGGEFILGDLHANTVKLLNFMVRHGLMEIAKEDYDHLVRIYYKKSLSSQDITHFYQILEKAKFNKGLLRLIGDVLCDRGKNDFLTLLVLTEAMIKNASVEILLSNHDADFIQAYETKDNFDFVMLLAGHSVSMLALNDLIKKGVITHSSVIQIVDKVYKPTLKLLSYSLNENKESITLYSHAAIGLNNIQHIAKSLNVEYKDDTATDLAMTIDKINAVFSEYVKENKVHELWNSQVMFRGYQASLTPEDEENFPIVHLIWNRKYGNLQRPSQHNNYRIWYAHGHDRGEPTQGHIINLDNELGKSEWATKGSHPVLCTLSGEEQLKLERSKRSRKEKKHSKYKKEKRNDKKIKADEGKERMLCCIDFDNTITNVHTHNALVAKNVLPGQGKEAFQTMLETEHDLLKNPEMMRDFIRTALLNNHHVAIVSYTDFAEIIPLALRAIGLSEEEVSRIFIRGGFPINEKGEKDPSFAGGKKQHIDRAMEHFGFYDKRKVILIDDSVRNIAAAKIEGHITVQVPGDINPSPEYLLRASQYIASKKTKPAKTTHHKKKEALQQVKQASSYGDDFAKLAGMLYGTEADGQVTKENQDKLFGKFNEVYGGRKMEPSRPFPLLSSDRDNVPVGFCTRKVEESSPNEINLPIQYEIELMMGVMEGVKDKYSESRSEYKEAQKDLLWLNRLHQASLSEREKRREFDKFHGVLISRKKRDGA